MDNLHPRSRCCSGWGILLTDIIYYEINALHKKYLLTFVFLWAFLSGKTQFQERYSGGQTPYLRMPASLFKVLDRPLGTYTGTIPVNFPLCKVTSGPLSADVALNYNSTGGISVEETRFVCRARF